jgi:hypothetical protein
MSILEILFLLVALMFVVGLASQALWDLTRLDRIKPKDEPEQKESN